MEQENNTMTRRAKVAWLGWYRYAVKQNWQLHERLVELRSVATHTTRPLHRAAGGRTGGLPAAAERCMHAEADLRAAQQQAAEIRQEIEDVIATLPSTTDIAILYQRYIEGKKWEDIAVAMHYDARWVHRRHDRAVDQMQIGHGTPC